MYHKIMENEVVLDHPNLRIIYVEKGSYNYEIWRGSTPELVFKDLVKKAQAIMYEKKVKGIILDAREHKGLDPEMQQYAAISIGKFALEVRPIKKAIIVPENVFSKYSLENYSYNVSKTDCPVTIKFFIELYKAKRWMEEEESH